MSNNTNAIASAADYRFDPGEDLSDLGGVASRFNHNVAAITLIKRLEAEAREPGALAPEEQRVLSKYTGWGDSDVLGRARSFASWNPQPASVHQHLGTVQNLAAGPRRQD